MIVFSWSNWWGLITTSFLQILVHIPSDQTLVAYSCSKWSTCIVDSAQQSRAKACNFMLKGWNWIKLLTSLVTSSTKFWNFWAEIEFQVFLVRHWPSEPGSAISITSRAETSLIAAMGIDDKISSPRKKYWLRTTLKIVRYAGTSSEVQMATLESSNTSTWWWHECSTNFFKLRDRIQHHRSDAGNIKDFPPWDLETINLPGVDFDVKFWISQCLQLASCNFRSFWVLGAPKTSHALKNQTDINKVNVLIIPELHHQGPEISGADLCHLVNLLAKFHHFSQIMLPSELPHNLSKNSRSLFEGCKGARRYNYTPSLPLVTPKSWTMFCKRLLLQYFDTCPLWSYHRSGSCCNCHLTKVCPTEQEWRSLNTIIGSTCSHRSLRLWSWVTMKCVPKANIMIATKALLWTSYCRPVAWRYSLCWHR